MHAESEVLIFIYLVSIESVQSIARIWLNSISLCSLKHHCEFILYSKESTWLSWDDSCMNCCSAFIRYRNIKIRSINKLVSIEMTTTLTVVDIIFHHFAVGRLLYFVMFFDLLIINIALKVSILFVYLTYLQGESLNLWL